MCSRLDDPSEYEGPERRVEDPDDPESHHPSCCGSCDECLRVCWGYHGRERRKVAFAYPVAALQDRGADR